jgi:transcriptional regulator with XRE-family HTH domain
MPKATTVKPKEPIKDRLRRLRVATGHTASSLAHAVGVTEGAIRQMESGQTAAPSFAVGVLLARELGVTAEYFAFGEDGAKAAAAAAKANAGAVTALARRVDAIELEVSKLRRRR